MNFRKLFKFDNSHIPKRFSFRDGKKHVYHNIANRLGDEIFNTALIKYLKKEKNYHFHYTKNCYAIDPEEYYPDKLVKFENKNFLYYGLENFDPGCLWLWNQMLREKGFFCELKERYDSTDISLDVVFVPLIQPEYNPLRELNRDCAVKIFESILELFPKTVMLVDANKKNEFQYSHPNFFYSSNLNSTFSAIKKSKVFIGCDTGVTHYAAGIGHPRIVAIYPDYKLLNVDNSPTYVNLKNFIKHKFEEKNIFDYSYCAIPCCDPKNCRVLLLKDNWVSPSEVISKIFEMIDIEA